MMAKKIDERYASMNDVAAALTEFLKAEGGKRKAGSDEAQRTFSAESGLRALFEATDETQQSIIQQRADAKVKKPTWKPKTSPVAKWKALPPKWKAGIATGIAAVLLIASIVLIFRPASGGILKIEIEGEDIEVSVDGETITLTDKKWEGKKDAKQHTLAVKIGGQTLTIGSSGELKINGGKVTLKLNGAELTSDKFEIVRGKTTVVRISYVKDPVSGPVKPGSGDPSIPVSGNDPDGWITLFDGKNLNGWDYDEDVWKVEDGAIVGRFDKPMSGNNASIVTNPKFADFILRYEFKIEAGRTDVLFRGQLLKAGRGALILYGGYFFHIRGHHGRWGLRSRTSRPVRGAEPQQPLGFPDAETGRKLGKLDLKQWNECEITAIGNRIKIVVGGITVLESVDDTFKAGSIGFAPQGRSAATVAFRNIKIKPLTPLLDGPAGEMGELTFNPGTVVDAMALSPDGRHVAVGGKGLPDRFHVYDIAAKGQPPLVFKHGAEVRHLAYTADGSRIVSAGVDNESVRVWDAATGKELRRIGKFNELIKGLVVSADGRWCATLDQNHAKRTVERRAGAKPSQPPIRFWSLQNGDLLGEEKADASTAWLTISPDGRYLASNAPSKARPMIYSIDDGKDVSLKERRELPIVSEHSGSKLVFSRNGRFGVSSGTRKGECRIGLWRIASGTDRQCVESSPNPKRAAEQRSVAFAHGDAWILGGNEKGELKIWDRTKLENPLHVLKSPDGKPINEHLFVTLDNRFAVTAGDSTIRVWRLPKLVVAAPELVSDRKIAEHVLKLGGRVYLPNLKKAIRSTASLPDGEFLVRGLYFDRVRLSDDDLKLFGTLSHLDFLNFHGECISAEQMRLLLDYPLLRTLLLNDGATDAHLATVGKLTKLTTLDISSKRVTDAGVQHLAGLSNLTTLGLQYADIHAQGLAVVASMKNLESLSLRESMIRDADLAAIAGMSRLSVLNMRSTAIGDAGLAHLKDMTALADLYLTGTRISDVGLKPLGSLTKLNRLDLSQTKVTGSGLAALSHLPQLAKLFLVDTKINDEGLQHIVSLSNLTWLSLHNTNVTDAGMKHLENHKKLVFLYLNGTKVGDEGLKSIGTLTQIRELLLRDTKVTDAGIAHLKGLRLLKWLYLSGTKVSDKSVPQFVKFSVLWRLRLSNTQVTPAGIKKIGEALPDCRVIAVPGQLPPDAGDAADKKELDDAQRDAAAFLLRRRGVTVWVEIDGNRIKVQSGEKLPAEPFSVVELNLAIHKNFTDDAMAMIALFPALTSLELCHTGEEVLRTTARQDPRESRPVQSRREIALTHRLGFASPVGDSHFVAGGKRRSG